MIDIVTTLQYDEGVKYHAYLDTMDIVTCGTCQSDPALEILHRHIKVGDTITNTEVTALLNKDLARVNDDLHHNITGYATMSDEYKVVLQNLCFNMGIGDLLKFKTFLGALRAGDTQLAIRSLKGSRYYGQVRNRADRQIMVLNGLVPPEYIG